jgi:hypothetical protein
MGENYVIRILITWTLPDMAYMIKVIKSRRIGWLKYVTNIGGMTKHCVFWPVNGN